MRVSRRSLVAGLPGLLTACASSEAPRSLPSVVSPQADAAPPVAPEPSPAAVPAAEPERLAREFDAVTNQTVAPWYDATRAFDRHRLAEIDADLAGVPYRTPDPAWAMTTALYASAMRDPDALRAQTSIASMLAMPPEALAVPGLMERVVASGPTPRATRTRLPGTTSWSPPSRTGRDRSVPWPAGCRMRHT